MAIPTCFWPLPTASSSDFLCWTAIRRPPFIRIITPWEHRPVHYIVTNFNWQPSGLALLANGQLAVSDTLSNAIYVVSTNDYTSNTGPHLLTGANGAGYDDGSPAFAMFNQPHGLAASADGSLIVCDTMNNRLRVIDTTPIPPRFTERPAMSGRPPVARAIRPPTPVGWTAWPGSAQQRLGPPACQRGHFAYGGLSL
jgi:hypothetical protein